MKRQTFVLKEPFSLLTPWLTAQLFELEGTNFPKAFEPSESVSLALHAARQQVDLNEKKEAKCPQKLVP